MTRFYRKLIRHGGSTIVCLPAPLRRAWNLAPGDHVVFDVHDDHVTVLPLNQEGHREGDPLPLFANVQHSSATEPTTDRPEPGDH